MNIMLLLHDIINGKVNESYYQNTIEMYEGIAGCEEGDRLPVINQAIRLNNTNLLYYLYFIEDEEIEDRIIDALGGL